MIKIFSTGSFDDYKTSRSVYSYGNYEIQYSLEDGLFHIINDGSEIGNGFSSDRDAEEYIDNNLTQETRDIDTQEYDNNLPVKSTTLKNLGRKYKNCIGTAYILSSEYKDKYATTNGIGDIDDPDLMIFKSTETARQNKLHRRSNFGIEEVKLVNGNIKF